MASPAPNLTLVTPRKSFREIYDAEFDFVWRLMRRYGLDERQAEDGAQVVFLRIHQNLADYDPKRSLRAWIAGFAWNVASEMRKRASARYERPAADELPDVGHDGHERMDGSVDAVRLVERALAWLSDDQREVVILHLLEERPMPEVEEILKVPENTLRTRLRKAKEIIIPRLQKMMRGPS